ncbi:MAG: dephospho-CoA kinase [Candidatus Acidiferrum sp.]
MPSGFHRSGEDEHKNMLKMGLTGGIASGKSAVAAMLREMGFAVLEADAVAHKLLEPGQAVHDEVLREFGAELADASGKIDRKKLGTMVFADPVKLAKLNAMIHPRVEEAILRQFAEWQRSGVRDAGFVEAALLVEAGIAAKLDGLVLAYCRPEQQMERLRARGMSEIEAKRRLAAQMPVEEKLKHATETIDCSGTLEETRSQVRALAAEVRRRALG